MTLDRHALAKERFLAALNLEPLERAAFLAELAREDAALETEVRAMLAFDESAASFLARPAAPPAARPTMPERIGPFRVLREIGAGGMGTVYEAEQEKPRRRVALKVLGVGMASPRFARRFEFEAELLARLSHPGIAQVYETGTADGALGPQPYIAMELVDGKPLTEQATALALDRRARIELLVSVADAVEHAHRRGVIHRDLKPANILVDAQGRPKVLDFGIGRALDAESALATLATETGQILGTLQYMSPEQALGAGHAIDTRADVYALGVLLYELLTGKPPYPTTGKPLHDALRTVMETESAPLAAHDRTLAGDLETIVARALEKEPERRYGSAGALADDLRRHLAHEPILAQPATRVYRLKKFVRRHRALVAGASATFAVLVLGAVGMGWMALVAGRRARDAREAADTAQGDLQHLLLDGIAQLDPRELGAGASASEVFERVESRLEGAFGEQPTVEAAVRDALGTIWRALGKPERAEPLLVRALEVRRELYGERDARTLETMEHLATCLGDLGRSEETLALCEAVHAGRVDVLGPRHRSTLVALNDLAVALWSRGRTEALERLREVVRLRTEELGAAHEDTLSSRGNLAVMLGQIGEVEEALGEYEAVLREHRAAVGPDHPDTLRANLAHFRESMGMLAGAEAEAEWRELLLAHQKCYGPEHPRTAHPMLGLAGALYELDRLDEAEPLYRRACELLDGSLGRAHRESLGAKNELARFLQRSGRAEEAVAIARDVVAVHEDGLPDLGPGALAIALNHLGQSLRRAARPDEALAVFDEAIAAARGSEDVLSDALSQCLYNKGVLLRSELARPADAVPCLEEALALDRGGYPEGHDVLAGDLFHLASALLDSGRPADAEPYLRALLAPPYDAGPEHERTPGRLRQLGTCLAALGRYAEAEESLAAAVERAEAVLGADDPGTETARAELARVRAAARGE